MEKIIESNFIDEQDDQDDVPTGRRKIVYEPIREKIPVFPIHRPTLSDALKSFRELCDMDSKSLIERTPWFSRSVFTFPKLDYVIGLDNTGNMASNHFHFPARMACESKNAASPIRSWFDPDRKKNIEGSKFYKTSHQHALQLRGYVASQFRCSAAKCFYELFGSTKIFDPCGGWGDRMCGALASKHSQLYYCRDVNPLVFLGYEAESTALNKELLKQKDIYFEMRGSEVDSPILTTFDTVFTSPPYFQAEKYDGLDQSWKKYTELEDWLNKFLFKICDNAWSVLDDNGVLCINISDIFLGESNQPICQPLYEYMMTKLGCSFVGCIGYKMNKRLNSASDQDGIFVEPMMIFGKNNKRVFEDYLNKDIQKFI